MVVIFARGPDGDALWAYAMARDWEDDTQIVNDADVLMRLVRSDRVGVVLCANFDGLAGSVSQLVAELREFISRRIALIIPDRINTLEAPQVFLETLDCIVEFKNCVAREATEVGLSKARRRGVRLGRPKIAHRYREDVAKLRARGLSGRAISKALGLSSSSVFRIIGAVV